MAKTIKESLDLLDTSRTDIRNALSEKDVTAPTSMKISEVDDYIKQISGGGGTSPFNYLEFVQYNGREDNVDQGRKITEGPLIQCHPDTGWSSYYYYKVKAKAYCTMCCPDTVSEYSTTDLSPGDEVIFKHTYSNHYQWDIIYFTPSLSYTNHETLPDMLIIGNYESMG